MTGSIDTSIPQISSMAMLLVNKDVCCNVSYLVGKLINEEKYCDDLRGLFGEEDEEGRIAEVLEYWVITPRLAEELKARGELVTEFFDLDIWGRQTSGQHIADDAVILEIAEGIVCK